MISLGNFLREFRKERGVTLLELEKRYSENRPKSKAPIKQPLLSRYETGVYELSEERLRDILVYGFNMTATDASQLVGEYIAISAIHEMSKQDSETIDFLKNFIEEATRKLKESNKMVAEAIRKKEYERSNMSNANKHPSSSLHEEQLNLHPSNLIPVYDGVGAGLHPDTLTEVVEYYPNMTKFPNERILGNIVHGDSMEPTIMRGDRIIILKDGFGKPENDGLYVFWMDGNFAVKRVKKPKGADHMLLLSSDNPKYEDQLVILGDGVDCVGKVLEIHHIVK